jgi:hypothetical protein
LEPRGERDASGGQEVFSIDSREPRVHATLSMEELDVRFDQELARTTGSVTRSSGATEENSARRFGA